MTDPRSHHILNGLVLIQRAIREIEWEAPSINSKDISISLPAISPHSLIEGCRRSVIARSAIDEGVWIRNAETEVDFDVLEEIES